MTTIEDVLTYIDGSKANGRLVIGWKPFTIGGVNAAGGELEWQIVDGAVSISLYSNTGAQPTGSYYVAKYELENGAVYLEQWVVPNLPTVNLGQVRVSFPPTPSVMISPLQLTSLNAQPGMFLQWDGQRWVPAYPSTFNLDPNWIAITTDASGNDVGVIGSPVHLGNSVTIHIPDAGPVSRGVVTTSPQTFAGVKTFTNKVNISTSIQFALRSVSPVYGELLGFGTGGADTSLSFGGNFIASRVSPVDRPYVRADNFIGSSMDLATFGIIPTAVMPGSLANPARTLAAFLLPVAGTVDWTGIGTDTTGALWLRTGTSTSAGFLYLDTAGNVTAREFRMDPYQHLNAPGVEAVRSDATMVMYSGTTDWAGYGVNSTPEIWFRMGPNAAGAYYYFGAGGARFPGNLTVGNITVSGGVTLPPGTYVPTSRRINTSTGLTGGGPLTADLTLSAVDNTTTQKVEAAQAGVVKAMRKRLNFIAGAGQLITVVDDSGNDQANVTITSSTSGSASPSIYSVNGTPIGTQPELNLVAGTNVILNGANNSGLNRVDITVTTSGGAAITDPTTAIGDLVVRGTATPSPLTRLGVGATTGYVLTTDLTTAPFIKWADRVPITRQIIAGAGLGGGGALGGIAATDITLTANVVSVNGQTGAVVLTAANVGGVPTTRQVIAGTGLTGGGPLSSDVTLAVVNDTVTERVRISNAGTLVGTRQQINFIQGSNITLTVADVPGSNWVGVTVAATTSGLSDPTTTKGDLIVRPVGPPATRMGVGATDGMVLTVDSTDATFGIKWKVVPLSPQSPWASDIDGAGFRLTNASSITIGTTLNNVYDGIAAARPFLASKGDVNTATFSSSSALVIANPDQTIGNWSQLIFATLNSASSGIQHSAAAIAVRFSDRSGDGLNKYVAGDMIFGTAPGVSVANTGPQERMRINSSGNVGIGTTGPIDKLQVRGGTDVNLYVGTAGRTAGNNSAVVIGTINDAVNANIPLEIRGNPTCLMVGNVGIGTTGPLTTLHVNGPIHVSGLESPSLNSPSSATFDYANTGNARVLSFGPNTSTRGGIQFLNLFSDNTGALFSMTINALGNVGIGMTNPGNRLQVAGAIVTTAALTTTLPSCLAISQEATDWTRFLFFGPSAVSYGRVHLISSNNDASGQRIVFASDSNGRVGFGAVPSGQVHAVTQDDTAPSSISVWDGRHFVVGQAGNGGGVGITYNGSAGYGVINAISPGAAWRNLVLQSGGGAVGIGKVPSYMLDVGTGDINTAGVFRRSGNPIGQVSGQYNFTGSRALGTVYQNATGIPIFVSVYAIVNVTSYIKLLTDGGNPPTLGVSAWTNIGTGAITAGGSVAGWVMPSNFYKVETGGATLTTWMEWI